MHHDFQMYWAPSKEDEYTPSDLSKHPDTWMKPMVKAPPSDKVVVVPASWVFDDWPAFQFNWRVANSVSYLYLPHGDVEDVLQRATATTEADEWLSPSSKDSSIRGRGRTPSRTHSPTAMRTMRLSSSPSPSTLKFRVALTFSRCTSGELAFAESSERPSS